MIVVCTGCSAKFRVADEKVGPRGVRLRCPKCRTVFAVERPAEPAPQVVPVQGTESPAEADPFASPPTPSPRLGPPPLPRRATTLDARAAFDVDLEPHLGASTPPADPFAALPAAAAPVEPPADPFAEPPREPEDAADPFAALVTGALEPVPSPTPPPAASFEAGFDPFGPPPGPAADGPSEGLGAPPFSGPEPFGGVGLGSSLSLEEATTPPARRLARRADQAPMSMPMPMLASTEDPFASTAPLDPGLSELDEGVVSTAGRGAGAPALARATPRPEEPTSPPLQLDPFTAAAVAADTLAVADTHRGAAPPAPARPAAEEPPAPHALGFHETLVSAMALAALLLLALAILVIWRGGLSPSDALRPSAILAALSPRPPSGPLAASEVTSGLYERDRGAPLLFVKGTVTSTASEPLEGVRVVVEVVREGAVVVRGEVPVGAVPGPETLRAVADAAALTRAIGDAATPGAARLAPGGSAPFLAAFTDYPANLAGATLRIHPEAGTSAPTQAR